MAFDAIPNLAQPHKAGKVKMLAITSATRSELLPEVPTFSEAGYPVATGETWIGASVRSNGIKLSIIDKPAWAAAPRQPDAFAQSSCLV